MHYSSSDVCALSKLSLDTGSEREMKEKNKRNPQKKGGKKKDNSYLQFRFHHYNLTN